jgi:hypothetical protein
MFTTKSGGMSIGRQSKKSVKPKRISAEELVQLKNWGRRNMAGIKHGMWGDFLDHKDPKKSINPENWKEGFADWQKSVLENHITYCVECGRDIQQGGQYYDWEIQNQIHAGCFQQRMTSYGIEP